MMARLNKVQKLYLMLIQDELKTGKRVVFEDCDEPGNRYINCPSSRAVKKLNRVSKPVKCPFDMRTGRYCEWGCFEHCKVFEGKDGIARHVNPSKLKDIEEKIEKLLK